LTRHPSWNQLDTVYSTELVIVDEADRLRTAGGLEQLRDFFDRRDLGMILIGMPDFDPQLARYPQRYGRIVFAHQKPLDSDDPLIVLANPWHEFGLLLDPGDENDVETVSAVVRIGVPVRDVSPAQTAG
jgi:hypothetical protein